MGQITIPKPVHDQISLLARAWRVSETGAIERLLAEFQAADPMAPETDASGVPIHVVYQGIRTEALFDPVTHRVIITNGPLEGRSWKSPSGAAVAVVRQANPTIRAERNGWASWIVNSTGEALQSLR